MSETMKFYKDCRANFNEVRRKLGLPPVLLNKKLRTCLRCDRHFPSIGVDHRICKNCEHKDERYI